MRNKLPQASPVNDSLIDMSTAPATTSEPAPTYAEAVAALLARTRYELVPLRGVEEKVLEHVPKGTTLTVTASPTRGLDPTLELAERLAAGGYDVVPHLAARLVRDDEHLRSVLERMARAGMTNAFVIAGDATEPAGRFEGAAQLLRAIAATDHGLQEIGIGGYPEGHPFLDDETLAAALEEKAAVATYIVSQICFDAEVTAAWIDGIRARGVTMPILVGIPGAVRSAHLLRTSTRIGIGDSMRFLRKHGTLLGRLLLPGAYKPDKLIRGLARSLVDPAARIDGFHVFTFNQLESTERWRQRELERLGATRRP